jgi:quercetin dioxygenase-like cupin family protein
LKFEKLNFTIVLFSVITIVSFSLTIFTEEAWSLRELDYDRDGVLDEFDECLTVPETYNKYEDTDGCPDSISEEITQYQFPDSDGDGIEDRLDSCVYLPETFNDYLDYDGCPEIVPNISDGEMDSDSDTIPDSIDACPLEKETFNEFKDADGCPDSSESIVSSTSKELPETDNQCRGDKVEVMRISGKNLVCVALETAEKWEDYGIAKIVMPLVIEDRVESEEQLEEITSKTEPEINLPDFPHLPEIPPDLIASADVSSQTILDTDKTVIGQDISYPSGSPQITSKIVTIPVGAETGPHLHEYPLFVYVMGGEITVDYGDHGIKTFVKGDSFLEAINYTHNGKNNGDKPTEILVVLVGEN